MTDLGLLMKLHLVDGTYEEKSRREHPDRRFYVRQ